MRATKWRIEVATGIVLATVLFLAGCAGSKREPVVAAPPSAPSWPQAAEAPPEVPAESEADQAAVELEPSPAPLAEGAAVLADEPGVADDAFPGEEVSEAPHDELLEVPGDVAEDRLAEELALVEEVAPTFDIPIVVNDRVVFWLDFYANRKRDFFRGGLERSGRYVERFREIFREAGLPEDLVYMAHVESAFKTTAYSRARARGIFQFIASTGRRYGLRIDSWVDERVDPEKSARAAAAYLEDLYAEFGDWYLALAAYNAGEGRIRSAIRRSGSKDFWRISGTRYIRRETKNYVPAILAATMLAKEPATHGLSYRPEPKLEYDTIDVEGAVDLQVLARCAGRDLETLKQLNPALRRGQTPPGATTSLRVPPGTGETTLAALALVPPSERVLYVRHVVRRGDTLSAIASRYGVSVSAIQLTNHMGRRTTIHVGHELTIPTAGGDAPAVARSAPASVDLPPGQPLTYRVRRGDTLSAIARRHATTPEAIAAVSGIGLRSTLRVGQSLIVVPGVRSASAAARATGRETTSEAPDAREATLHTVRAGETLSSIAERYGTTAQAIARTNGRSLRQVLHVGEELRVVPASARTHTVRRGDSLWDIAQRYDTTIDNLCAWNAISRSAPLRPGTRLTVAVE